LNDQVKDDETGSTYSTNGEKRNANRLSGTEKSEFKSRYGQEFSLLSIAQTGSWVHLGPMGKGGSFCGVKRQGREPDQSPPISAEVKKT
jgi:hypothetical protein